MIVILSLGGNLARLDTAIPLCEKTPGSHLVISSESPADVILQKIKNSSLTPDRYTIDESAWDTVTNFTNTLPLVKNLGGTELWVVTDGFHMLRAMCVAKLIYLKSGVKISPHPSSPVDRHESSRLVLFDSFRAAVSRFTGNTIYTQQVYDDRAPVFYNDYYTARQEGAPVSPR